VDFRDTADEAAFRSALRDWLEANVPDELRGHRGGAARFDGPEVRAWSRALHEGGYAGLAWPTEYGGGARPTRTRRSSSRSSPAQRRRRTSA